jgi:hypothetical protein
VATLFFEPVVISRLRRHGVPDPRFAGSYEYPPN